ncbi:TrkA C-terminal domain-containing protein [Salidesulfovibrio brasiliensis]|uniref:TrkA C-terminal domain-containing protein n=1 Tax=Salidesulfovibrio brasiliensis TaxID=221711 RepID=UPI0006D240F9|nr:TrkA C-terminal domain-containing protein [Salidesulfovibrio brasiliensis]
MIAIGSLLLVLVVSLLLTRMASLALTHTGLSRQAAAFQARSAFTGVGFTTAESEKVVNHPVRRRILLMLMLLGNAGVVTAIATLMMGFLDVREGGSLWLRVGLLSLGLAGLIALSMSQRLDRLLSRIVLWALKRYTSLNVRDYAALLHLAGEFAIGEVYVHEHDWMAERALSELKLSEEGVVVLAVTRGDGTFLGAPKGGTRLHAGDMLVVYGRTGRIQSIDDRRQGSGGELAHVEAVAEEKKEQKREQALDEERSARKSGPAESAEKADSEDES